MMTITSIEPYRQGKGRMAVYLNDEFAFVLYKGELSKYKLAVGTDMTDELYNRICEEILIKRARLRGMNLLMKQDRTEADVRKKLYDGGYPQNIIDNAVDYLKSFHYVDDMRYCTDYINAKKSQYSRKDIVGRLRAKGIPADIVEAAMCELLPEDNQEILIKLIKKKCHQPDELGYEGKMKLYAYLYRKGFDMAAIERAFESISHIR